MFQYHDNSVAGHDFESDNCAYPFVCRPHGPLAIVRNLLLANSVTIKFNSSLLFFKHLHVPCVCRPHGPLAIVRTLLPAGFAVSLRKKCNKTNNYNPKVQSLTSTIAPELNETTNFAFWLVERGLPCILPEGEIRLYFW